MPKWYLNKLYTHTDQPTLTFAFNGTVNWMRGLAILSEKYIDDLKIKAFYDDVQRRRDNPQTDLVVFENLFMAIHNLHSLKAINHQIDNPYSVARGQIVSWYYSIYYASSAMIGAFSGATQETHAGTSKVWQNDIVDNNLAMHPFDLSLKTLVDLDVKAAIKSIRNGNIKDLNTYPTSEDEAFGCVISYLSGTADYKKWEAEEQIKKSKEFKSLGVTNFRTRAARELRDNRLKNGLVNFLIQAFRYRGKAHYRDSVFLSYGIRKEDTLKQFLTDLETVATSFVKMASFYCKKRVNENDWKSFIEDLEENVLFEFNFEEIIGNE